jgi:hypothetical protein
MYLRIFCLFLALSVPLFSFKLKDSLTEAKAGDYFATQQGKTYSLLLIRECSPPRLVIEEITIPAIQFDKQNLSFRDWLKEGAPGHTLWTISQVRLDTGEFEECYSYLHQGWLDLSEGKNFLSTLLGLEFYPVKKENRKMVGFPPKYGMEDKRTFWNPPLTKEGERVQCPCSAYYTRWPNDYSEIAKRKIEAYLPDDSSIAPTYFPYWVEVDGKVTTFQLRVIDSGTNLHSSQHPLPQKPPRITKVEQDKNGGLTVSFNAPSYFDTFHVIAENQDRPFTPPLFLPYDIQNKEDQYTLTLTADVMHDQLDPMDAYQIYLSPQDSPHLSVPVGNSLVINNFR